MRSFCQEIKIPSLLEKTLIWGICKIDLSDRQSINVPIDHTKQWMTYETLELIKITFIQIITIHTSIL